MYNKHFGFSSQPFSISPNPKFLYMSERHREALAHLIYGAKENGGFVLLTGQVGTGKTTLIRLLIEQTSKNIDFALCLYSDFSEKEFLCLILDELGVSYPKDEDNKKNLISLLNRHALKVYANGRRIVIIIDEAQNLSKHLLEQIRLLTNLETNTRKLLRIILVGQEELQEVLSDNSLRQLAQRITTRYHLTTLDANDVDRYIAYRLKRVGGSPLTIPSSVRKKVYSLSRGTPRLINVICDRALLGAFSDGRDTVTVKDVSIAAKKVLTSNQSELLKLMPFVFALLFLALSVYGAYRVHLFDGLLSAISKERAEPEVKLSPVVELKSQPDYLESSLSEKKNKMPKIALESANSDLGISGIKKVQSSLEISKSTLFPDKIHELKVQKVFLLGDLIRFWSADFTLSVNDSLCDGVKSLRLVCIERQANLDMIRQMNRPVLIELKSPFNTEKQWVLLSHLSTRATIELRGQIFDVDIEQLKSRLSGKVFFVLTKPNTKFSAKPGSSSKQVSWLRDRLDLFNKNTYFERQKSQRYSKAVQKSVASFQSFFNLTSDGVVGDETLIYLYNLVNDEKSPSLKRK